MEQNRREGSGPLRNQYHLQGSKPETDVPAPSSRRRRNRRILTVLIVLFLLVGLGGRWADGFFHWNGERETSKTLQRAEKRTEHHPSRDTSSDEEPADWWDPSDPNTAAQADPEKETPRDQKIQAPPATGPSHRIPHNNWHNPDMNRHHSFSPRKSPEHHIPARLHPPDLSPVASPNNRQMQLSVRFPYWDEKKALDRLEKMAEQIDELNYPWLDVQANGTLRLRHGSEKLPARIRSIVDKHRMRQLPVIGSQYAPGQIHRLLQDPKKRDMLTREILRWVEHYGYDGVEIQFQPLLPQDRKSFVEFVQNLSRHLHEKDRWLSIAVHPKTNDAGISPVQQAQDWKSLGEAADSVKIMAYHYSWNKEGPSAPLSWMEQVLNYALQTIPAKKINVSLSGHGYIWSDPDQLAPLSYSEAQRLIRHHQLNVHRGKSGEPWFRYRDDGETWIGYYQDAIGYRTKFQLLKKQYPKLGGITHWYLGAEDPKIWRMIEQENRKPSKKK